MPRNVTIDEECIGEDREKKRKEAGGGQRKKLKLDTEEGVAWGEEGSKEEGARRNFLYTTLTQRERRQGRQGTIQLLSGLEWMCRSVQKEIADTSVEMDEIMK